MKKILLTGSSVFIGSAILNKLSKQYIIYCITRNKKKIKLSNNIFEVNYKNYKELNTKLKKLKVDVVIHCATHYVKKHNFGDIQKLAESNLIFGNIILENLQFLSPKKFINFSSVWENYNNIEDNHFNLYSVYKKNFRNIMLFYKKKYSNIKFYNLFISDTFGESDTRMKIINLLRLNYKKNKQTKIVSSQLFLNLINVEDINEALKIILNRNIKEGDFNLVNPNNFLISKIINEHNKINNKKITIKWESKKKIKDKIYKKKKLPYWYPKNSKMKHILDIIKQ